jgi:hypothetical protein
VSGLDEYVLGGVANLGGFATHNAGDTENLLFVGDQKVFDV